MEERIKEKEEAAREVKEHEEMIASFIQKTKEVADALFVPKIFEGKSLRTMHENSKKRALLTWHKKHIRKLEREIAEKREKLNEIREQNRIAKIEKHEKSGEQASVVLDLCCPLCGGERDTVITNCGHTFCRSCVQKMIDERNRKCESCGKEFSLDSIASFVIE